MTTPKPPSGTEVQHWRPFTEMFPWNTRLGQLFENMWQTAGHEGLTPGRRAGGDRRGVHPRDGPARDG